MVVFICDACGDSVKKPSVEKHKLKCRNCYSLSCIDCNKDFLGDGYKEHTKCISEEEKYSGKDFVPRMNANKGEKKQDEWIEKVQSAIENAKANNKLKHILMQIKNFDNIPRKKAKFGKFLENSLRIKNQNLIDEAWGAINPIPLASPSIVDENTFSKDEKSDAVDVDNGPSVIQDIKKLNKKERKALRAEKNTKKEKKDAIICKDMDSAVSLNSNSAEDCNSIKRKNLNESVDSEKILFKNGTKKKKKKLNSVENLLVNEDSMNNEVNKPENHLEKLQPNAIDIESNYLDNKLFENTNHGSLDITMDDPIVTGKFNWEDTIIRCVKKKKGQLSLKKLKKKVFTEYWSIKTFSVHAEQKASSKFQKAILKSTQMKLKDGDVYLL